MAHVCVLAIWEAEIRRTVVESQAWAKSSQDPNSKIPSQKKKKCSKSASLASLRP
jgi:hypothetical protein